MRDVVNNNNNNSTSKTEQHETSVAVELDSSGFIDCDEGDLLEQFSPDSLCTDTAVGLPCADADQGAHHEEALMEEDACSTTTTFLGSEVTTSTPPRPVPRLSDDLPAAMSAPAETGASWPHHWPRFSALSLDSATAVAFSQGNVDFQIRRSKPRASYPGTDTLPIFQHNPFSHPSKSSAAKRCRRSLDIDSRGSCGDVTSVDHNADAWQRTQTETPRSTGATPTTAAQLRSLVKVHRYREEFVEERALGQGNFGHVYKCVSRIDGCAYAIKKMCRRIKNNRYVLWAALREVYGHSALGSHRHLVRYHTAWLERPTPATPVAASTPTATSSPATPTDSAPSSPTSSQAKGGRRLHQATDFDIYVQSEYCNGGSLADEVRRRRAGFPEKELRTVLAHVAKALKFMHVNGFAHMDVKPGNIFIQYPQEENMCADEEKTDIHSTDCVYKLGDFGLVTATDPASRTLPVEEGDARYLALEILQDNHDDLPKGDIFSLGMTIYELARGEQLPLNDSEWESIRQGNIKHLPDYSLHLNQLIKAMTHPLAEKRPSAAEILNHPVLTPLSVKTKAQLVKELHAARIKNRLLTRKLQRAEQRSQKENLRSMSFLSKRGRTSSQ